MALLGAAEYPISRTQLSRFERGELLPPLAAADALDAAYQAEGWITLSISRLWRPDWNPWADQWPATYHAHKWPAKFAGLVWMKFLPAESERAADVDIDLSWGPWAQRISCTVPPTGLVLTTGKSNSHDDVSTTLNVTISRQMYVLFGADDDDFVETVIDIKDLWTDRDNYRARKSLGDGPL